MSVGAEDADPWQTEPLHVAAFRGLLGVRHAVTDAGVAFRVSGASPAFRHAAEDTGFNALLPDE